MSEREQIEAWLTSVENRRFGYNGADKTVAGPMRRSLASLDAANTRADEAEREAARLRLMVRFYQGDITKMELFATIAALTPEDIKCPDCEGRGWRPTGDGYGDEVCPTCAEDTQ